jgi:hypothetical protein
MIFATLASVSAFATTEGGTDTSENTTASPDEPATPPDGDTTTAPEDTTEPSPKKAVSFEVIIPSNFPATYREGDSFSTEEIVGLITYDDGTTATTTEIFADVPGPLDPADTLISFFFIDADDTKLNATTTLPITVIAIDRIEVSGESVTAEYHEGDVFGAEQVEALVITVIYADGSSKQVSPDECEILGKDAPLSIDAPYITVIYYQKDCVVPLNILETPEITGIQIVLTDSFNKYFTEGDTFDPKGLMIMAIYSGGKNPEVIASDINGFSKVTFSPALDAPLRFTDTAVTVTYSDGVNTFTAQQTIVVSSESVSEIKVSKNPNKMVYNEGETFDYAGMALTVVYKDGSEVVVSENFSVSHTNIPFILKSNSTETVDIEITYLDKSCTLPVSVIPAEVESVTVLSKPAKIIYNEGETFDPLGLVLVLNYTNPHLAPVSLPQDYYTCVPSTPLTATDTTIHVYFRGEDVKIEITVIPEETSAETTVPTEPTTDPTDTTETPPTDDTTVPPVVTTDPTVTTPNAPSDDTDETTRTPDVTTVGGKDDGGNTTLVVLWIVILSVIVIALVVLIIYYKRNFT